MELKVTKEKVLEAASKCSTARETLKTLFPEAFEEEYWLDLSKLKVEPSDNTQIFIGSSVLQATSDKSTSLIEIRRLGEFKDKGFFLSTAFDWEIVTEREGLKVLIPKLKK
ncbi:MAG TPA: hypothetical protein PLS56_01315 [Candidatus Dojkabacteria bacterium]|nr:hypothetical protein [Candidatus Dojkabacteria bacterium]